MSKRPKRQQPLRAEKSLLSKLREAMFEPIDIASIAVFRIIYGAVVFWRVCIYFNKGLLSQYYIDRTFHFKYYGFEWVEPFPGNWMYVFFIVTGILALCVMAGLFYRVASWALFFSLAYWFLLDQTDYLNHSYFLVLLAFLLALIPAHRAKSLDALWRPSLASETVPAWCLWIIQFQIGLVYFYGGIAKLNYDWLHGEPMRTWLRESSDFALIGNLLATETAVWFFSYGGVIFDLGIVPLLLWKRTRYFALLLCFFFNATNCILFQIGIFPVLMFAGSFIFLPPDWPRKVYFLFDSRTTSSREAILPSPSRRRQDITMALISVFVVCHLLIPFRHFLYPGNVHWTDEGHRFAWHMKLNNKTGFIGFFATDPTTGATWKIDAKEYLDPKQFKAMGKKTDMILQFAHYVADELSKDGYESIEIRVKSHLSLNQRESQMIIDPDVDLVKEPRNLRHSDWIVQLR